MGSTEDAASGRAQVWVAVEDWPSRPEVWPAAAGWPGADRSESSDGSMLSSRSRGVHGLLLAACRPQWMQSRAASVTDVTVVPVGLVDEAALAEAAVVVEGVVVAIATRCWQELHVVVVVVESVQSERKEPAVLHWVLRWPRWRRLRTRYTLPSPVGLTLALLVQQLRNHIVNARPSNTVLALGM